MNQEPYELDQPRRAALIGALREVCSHKGWILWAAQARTNHVHVVVEANEQPEKILNTFKSYASRNLNQMRIDDPDRKRWTRHGSTRWLWKDDDVQDAIRYVVHNQGEPMELYIAQLL